MTLHSIQLILTQHCPSCRIEVLHVVAAVVVLHQDSTIRQQNGVVHALCVTETWCRNGCRWPGRGTTLELRDAVLKSSNFPG